ncbi:hypothetical protein MKX03_017970, partial [Papaver bracteatum]
EREHAELLMEYHKTGELGCRILARQLVRLRHQITNLQGSRAQIRGVETHTQTMYASTTISTGMKGTTKAMTSMNRQMEPTKQAKVIKEFQNNLQYIDETLEKDEVLDEIGVDIASQLSSAPKGRIASNKFENAEIDQIRK